VKYLLDTNVISELIKPSPNPAVYSWVTAQQPHCHISAITIGEIRRGFILLPAGKRKSALEEVFQDFLADIESHVLPFNTEVARQWALLTARQQKNGRRLPVLGSMIEATALHWELTLVTRNTGDFAEVKTLDPWQ
jgi:predicted nucleic acid-binding protein